MKKYWKSFLSLIYPDTCYNCDVGLVDGEEKICLRCYKDFPLTNYHLQESNPLMAISTEFFKVKGAYCYLKYNKNGVAQKLLHELKYNGNMSIGLTMGRWFGKHIGLELSTSNVDYIIPLPLHRNKIRRRGYNQSEVIAKGISEVTGIPVSSDVLHRTKNISTQTKKGKLDRWRSTEQIYILSNSQKLAGKNVLLVDDVITTGATIVSALDILSGSEAKNIYFGALASGR